jgi:hypothetical protein
MDLTDRQEGTLENAEMRFLTAVSAIPGTEELQIVDINALIPDYQIKWLQHPGRKEQNRFTKLLSHYRPRGRRDQCRPGKGWREQF